MKDKTFRNKNCYLILFYEKADKKNAGKKPASEIKVSLKII
jgi:hypothetical protein